MCDFLTLGLPRSAVALARQQFGRGFALPPTANPDILRELPCSYGAVLVTSGMCSCNLDTRPGHSWPPQPSEDAVRAKYRARGWSEAKIDRAVQAARGRAPRQSFSGLRPDVASGVVRLAQGGVSVALVVHEYSGLVETERLTLTHRSRSGSWT
jgi:hypothetical protein